MSEHCLIAEFSDQKTFATALEVLDRSDVPPESVSVVTQSEEVPDSAPSDSFDTDAASPPGEQTTAATTLIGGTLGGVLGTATLMGPLLVAGPIAGMAAGAVGGSLLSAVRSYGVDRDASDQYQSRVGDGSRLVVVTGNDVELSKVERVLQTCGPISLKEFRST